MRLSSDPPLDAPVERALVGLLQESGGRASDRAPRTDAWREAALREGLEHWVEEPGYALSPRRTRGATRA